MVRLRAARSSRYASADMDGRSRPWFGLFVGGGGREYPLEQQGIGDESQRRRADREGRRHVGAVGRGADVDTAGDRCGDGVLDDELLDVGAGRDVADDEVAGAGCLHAGGVEHREHQDRQQTPASGNRPRRRGEHRAAAAIQVVVDVAVVRVGDALGAGLRARRAQSAWLAANEASPRARRYRGEPAGNG